MKIIKLKTNNFKIIVELAVKMLKQGGVIVYPTETAYGLGADFFNPRAVKKVYQIKGRNYQKPLSVIVGDLKMARGLAKFDKLSLRLAKKYWPGPLTLVLQETRNKKQVTKKSQILNPKFQTLGLRISSNKLATAIVRKLGRPLTATSANVSGTGECYSINEVLNQFSAKGGPASGGKDRKYQPNLIIDAGRLPKHQPSTVVRIINGQAKVLRKGKILPTLSLRAPKGRGNPAGKGINNGIASSLRSSQ